MENIVISISTVAYARLRRRAAQLGKRPEALSSELLEAALRPGRSGRTDTRGVLETAGQLRVLGPQLRRAIVKGVALEEVRDALSAAGGPAVSELLLQQRGPKA